MKEEKEKTIKIAIFRKRMKNKNMATVTSDYQPFLDQILAKIQSARYEMLKTVSKQTVLLFFKSAIFDYASRKINCNLF